MLGVALGPQLGSRNPERSRDGSLSAEIPAAEGNLGGGRFETSGECDADERQPAAVQLGFDGMAVPSRAPSSLRHA